MASNLRHHEVSGAYHLFPHGAGQEVPVENQDKEPYMEVSEYSEAGNDHG
jgi:hypothetical protein